MATQKKWDSCWINAHLVTYTAEKKLVVIENGALGIQNQKICWIGALSDLPDAPEQVAEKVYSADHHLITPSLIDCHTHLVFAGNRAHEFALRLNGASYEDIAKNGGGILSTVRATRATSEAELFTASKNRIEQMIAHGVTAIEIKSGYGLDLASELKILRVIKQLAAHFPITIKSTFLGAHALPPEFSNKDEYINFICETIIPQIAQEKLADSVDVFCEKIAFNLAQTERVFSAAKKYQLDVKLHAEQLSESNSIALAASYNALSVDHLEHLRDKKSLTALQATGTVAVLLPGAFYYLRETVLPPVELLREYQIPIAIATDCNPGTSPTTSLPLMLNMACTLFRLTPEEALLGVTINAAQALGLAESQGSLAVGKQANFVMWNVKHYEELAYYFGVNLCEKVVCGGEVI